MTDFMASGLFRLFAVPLVAAGFGAFIRYHAYKLRHDPINLRNVLTVWPELFIAAILNLLTLASDIAIRGGDNVAESLLTLNALIFMLFILLWATSVIAESPGSERGEKLVGGISAQEVPAVSAGGIISQEGPAVSTGGIVSQEGPAVSTGGIVSQEGPAVSTGGIISQEGPAVSTGGIISQEGPAVSTGGIISQEGPAVSTGDTTSQETPNDLTGDDASPMRKTARPVHMSTSERVRTWVWTYLTPHLIALACLQTVLWQSQRMLVER